MSCVLLFPGQGEQYPGMFADLPESAQTAAVFDEVSAALGTDARALDGADHLHSNADTQLALFTAGVASWRALYATGVRADYVAGHSVGAFAAAVACGTLTLADAAHAVHVRGTAMEQAYPSGYGMGVVLGLDENAVRELAEDIRTDDQPVYASNINAPRQIAVSGSETAVDRLLAAAHTRGATRARRLAVSVPAHCPLMDGARKQFAASIDAVTFQRPRVPFAGNVGGRTLRTAEAIRADLIDAIAAPVRWHDAISVLYERGARLFIQASPGDTLARLAEQAFPEARVAALQTTSPQRLRELADRCG